jgi:tetratricopeptide (TPR) repeat protein
MIKIYTAVQRTLLLVCTSLYCAGSMAQAHSPDLIFNLIASNDSAIANLPLTPFQYIPGAKWKEPDPSKVIKRTGQALALETLYKQNRYSQVAAEGIVFLQTEKADDELKLFIANSLAWNNRLKDAVAIYESILKSDFASEANLGLANIYRWQGQEHLAIPIYKSLLKSTPDNDDVKEGLRLALREIKPRAVITVGGSKDSSDITVHSVTLSAKWRDESHSSVWEIETDNYRLNGQVIHASGTDLTLRYKMLATAFKPQFELGVGQGQIFGKASLQLENIPLKIEAGRVNWGRLSANPAALAAGLTALTLGAQLNLPTQYGQVEASMLLAKVSDGNSVHSANFRFTPAWQPLSSHFKLFSGIESRRANFATINYWSPTEGYGSAYLGLRGEWGAADWDVNASAQIGIPIFGEAGKSASGALTAKRWINDELSVGLKLWAMSSVRDYQRYRAKSLYLSVEKLW